MQSVTILNLSTIRTLLGAIAPILIWITIKFGFDVSDRYLPSPIDVLYVFTLNEVNIFHHLSISFLRVFLSFILSIIISLYIGIWLFRSRYIRDLVFPSIQSIRAIPAVATVPFFILWFGFSETGRVLLFVLGISLNLIVAILQSLQNIDEKYLIAFRSYGMEIRELPVKILAPFALEKLLPTMRFSLTVLIGLSVIAELLGSQSGLGYLLQSARSTYSFDVVVACAILYGFLTIFFDYTLRGAWIYLAPWVSRSEIR